MIWALLLLAQEDLIEKLRSESIQERDAAAEAIVRLGPEADPLLERASKEADAETRTRLREIVARREVRKLANPATIALLKEVDVRVARKGWRELSRALAETSTTPTEWKIKEDEWKKLLPVAMEHCQRDEREALGDLAERHEVEEAVPRLLKWLEEGHHVSLLALAKLGAREAPPLCARFLKTGHPERVLIGYRALREFPPGAIGDVVDELLASEGSGAREVGCDLAGAGADRRWLPRLLVLAGDPDSGVRSHACSALGALGAKEAVEPLTVLLGDPEVGPVAAMALARLNAADAFPAILARARKERGDPTRETFLESAARINAARVTEVLTKDLSGELEDERRAWYLRALGKWGGGAALGEIRKAVGSPSPAIRHVVIEALGWVGEPRDAELLAPFLKDPEPFVRGQALTAMGRMGSDLSPAFALARDSREFVRIRFVEAAWQSGAKLSEGDLERLMGDSSVYVRRALRKYQAGHGRHVSDPELLAANEVDCGWLNGVGQPALWTRLRSIRIDEPAGEVPRARLVSLVAKVPGLKLTFSPRVERRVSLDANTHLQGEPREVTTVLDALLLTARRARVSVVLREEEVHVLPIHDAQQHWFRWLESRK